MNRGLLCLVVGGGLGLAGCSGKTTTPEPAAKAAPAAAAPEAASTTQAMPAAPPAVQVAVGATPDQVVTVFLNALKAGDQSTTASLLTVKAREETTKHDIEVDPQSAPNAQYQVNGPEYLPNNPNGAHVTSVWTETYEDGSVNYEIVWVLRRQPEGWRIAGMALEMIPGQDPSFLNFEDPLDMMQKRDDAIAAQQPPAAETAAQPEGPMGQPATAIER
ncbi:MAG: hypothetical protein WD872_15780 [Pirellulaceae bacterium]